MKKALLLLFFLFPFFASGQADGYFHLDSLPKIPAQAFRDPGVFVSTGWRYHKGDNPAWADPDANESDWIFVAPELDFGNLPPTTFEKIGWFRIHIWVDTLLINKAIALQITQSGASEIYLDGNLIHTFGKIDQQNPSNEERFDPQEVPVEIIFKNTQDHVLAIRYANNVALSDFKTNRRSYGGFNLKFADMRQAVFYKYVNSNVQTGIFVFYFTFFLALSFLHFTFFIFYRTNKSNLYYSIFAGAFGTYFLTIAINNSFFFPDFTASNSLFASVLADFYVPGLLAMLYSIFYKKLPKIFWLWMVFFLADFITTILHFELKVLGYLIYAIFFVESLRVIIASIYKKREGSWILGSGIITTIGFFALFFILSISGVQLNFNSSGWAGFFLGLLVIYVTLSIPLSMTIYLAREFSRTSKDLSKKLIEVEELSEKSIQQEKEKQKILAEQNEMLEVQVKERTSEISDQKKIIEEKNKDITDSINYAKRIQDALMPEQNLLQGLFPESFILFKPKDIVSGDFYWFTEHGNKKIIVAADCTGHGVPGALMSMIGSNTLNKLVSENGITDPGSVLNALHEEVRKALKQNESKSQTRDGMDLAIICIEGNKLSYAGAQRPLWMIKQNELIEIKADKFSIGGVQSEEKRIFKTHTFEIENEHTIYLSSDGYADQFGGENGKKLMTKNFKDLLLKLQDKSMPEQKKALDETIEKWKGKREQIDDILVIGIRL